MDTDMRSPTFRTPRSGKVKRPRSPPSPNPYERPNKRISLGGIPASPFPQTLPSPLVSAPPAVRDRQVSEDWVTRTRTLSIDNINASEGQEVRLPPVVELSSANQDENMNMDHDESMTFSQTLHPATQSSLPAHDGFASYPPSLSMSNSLSSTFNTSEASSLLSQHISSTTSLHSYQYPSPLASSDSLSVPSPQTHSSSNFPSPAQTPAPAFDQMPAPSTRDTSKKPRFTMGPRADCEKCRLGVPGHWAHFD
ncbi:hypothetical protein PHLGIDRAFT_180855 [Phlebiopsis gigantea 11061_1 CR5-6]|uniref:Uncharacterized protein n=1 Tax=Phlebiopsis gigantea (strain 11061_1 CR5-6) TaxID=745531 RepID=A0A0C3S7P7_PHLG1|nr:hypothetical protein PHLGIDRAFT_180855 [Phlebiopsis gigantea 11061_1 CR5-6]